MKIPPVVSPSVPPAASSEASADPARGFWPEGWWKWMELRIGVIPLPVVIALLGITGYFLRLKKLPPEICVMIGVIGVGGFLCAEIGKRLPILRNIGGGAILTTF